MAKEKKIKFKTDKSPKAASKASVNGNPKPNKMPHEVLLEIAESVKKLNKKYPVAFVRDGLEVQSRIGFRYRGSGRELVYSLNPNWPPTIADDVRKTIVKKAGEYKSIIFNVVED